MTTTHATTHAEIAAAARDLIGAHIQAQDAGRSDDLVALYAPDGTLELPGMPPISGHDAIREAFAGWAPTAPQKHLSGNTVVTVDGADRAVAVSDVVFFQRGEAGWAPLVTGRYEDHLRLVDGAWLIARRSVEYAS